MRPRHYHTDRKVAAYSMPGLLGVVAIIGITSHIAISAIANSIQSTRSASLQTSIKAVNRTLRNAFDAKAQGFPETITTQSLIETLANGRLFSDLNRNHKPDPGETVFQITGNLPSLAEVCGRTLALHIDVNKLPQFYLANE